MTDEPTLTAGTADHATDPPTESPISDNSLPPRVWPIGSGQDKNFLEANPITRPTLVERNEPAIDWEDEHAKVVRYPSSAPDASTCLPVQDPLHPRCKDGRQFRGRVQDEDGGNGIFFRRQDDTLLFESTDAWLAFFRGTAINIARALPVEDIYTAQEGTVEEITSVIEQQRGIRQVALCGADLDLCLQSHASEILDIAMFPNLETLFLELPHFRPLTWEYWDEYLQALTDLRRCIWERITDARQRIGTADDPLPAIIFRGAEQFEGGVIQGFIDTKFGLGLPRHEADHPPRQQHNNKTRPTVYIDRLGKLAWEVNEEAVRNPNPDASFWAGQVSYGS